MPDFPIQPPRARPLSGDEPIAGSEAVAQDFWAWALSDLRENVARSRLAEFLVARAVGAKAPVRVEWEPYDVRTPTGITVEVKSSAYLQAWPQRELSRITFGGLRSRTWNDERRFSGEAGLHADMYVFAIVTATQHEDYDALDVDGWEFYVLPRARLEQLGQGSLGLGAVRRLAGGPVPYAELGARIEEMGRAPDADTLDSR